MHRLGGEVRVFTRNLRDITGAVPEVATAVAELPIESVILDGEAITLRADGSPLPFQETMSRFSRQTGRTEAPTSPDTALTPMFFDCLHLNGEDLIDRPALQRFAALDAACPPHLRVVRITTEDAPTGDPVFEDTLASGHEGVMVKSLDSGYETGRPGVGWIKVKRAKTLDLVVIAIE